MPVQHVKKRVAFFRRQPAVTFHFEAVARLQGPSGQYFFKNARFDVPLGAEPVDEQIFESHESYAKKDAVY
jgi:hypothetical protein